MVSVTELGIVLTDLIDDQAEWSRKVFGSDAVRGPLGPLKHMAKEIEEVKTNTKDLSEWADLLILLLDASRRAGHEFPAVICAAVRKMRENRLRNWPEFDPTKIEEAVEHIR